MCKNRVDIDIFLQNVNKPLDFYNARWYYNYSKKYTVRSNHHTEQANGRGYNMNVAYVRVSTIEQNEARQIEGLSKYNIEKWFTEKVSGKNATDRPELNNMIDFVREGDTVFIHDFSRLARSTKDLLEIVERLTAKGVHLVSNKENIDTSTPTGKLMLTMIGAIAEFERQNMLDRQAEGIAIAKREGKYKGRKAIEIDNDLFKAQYDRYARREITKTELAKVLKVSRPTLDKMIREYNA